MSRLPIRARLTAAFALALVVVLAGAGLFVYLRLQTDLNESIDAGLRTRADGVVALQRRSGATLRETGAGALGDAEEGFAQLLDADGRIVDATGGARDPALRPVEAARAARGVAVLVERKVDGIEGTARVLARALPDRDRPAVVAVGQSLEDRDIALSGLVTSFAVGGPVAVVLASIIGYWLATAGLAPVEAMRRRAEQVSLGRGEERLPLPGARDEVRRLGETLNDMLARLQASFERERRFVADASHELRTPLAVIKAELEAALRRGGHSAPVQQSLVAAVEEADHMAQLADDLLLIARAADQGLAVRPERTHVRELLEQAAQRFVDRAREQGRAIRVDAPTELYAELDPLRARQALGNLIDNGLRHGQGDIALNARARGASLEIDVSDDGAGFSSDLAPRAFERFTRGDPARTRGGTGLGLAIVRAIAEGHSGSATIEQNGSGRTTVRLCLPLLTVAPSNRS